ncbi:MULTISPECIES: carboxylesterase/lipase family protein [Amycolatopsis]|uniref:Para-nitrobenzyl esterase n=2 Tax=Amycolatopsis TaxID=1813 RepID=A0A1I3WHD3_9PSEU|nr:carboxylesterase family protein [Amycolatopsis sacchari]SFK06862.1 para-nitrobenzyl esterase [Amycolatopsis sacchari]
MFARRTARLAAVLVTLGTALGALLTSASSGHAAADDLVVHTSGGPVRGLAAGPVDEFLGIPYAAPPVGALRWQPPQPASKWSGVRDATRFAPDCAQPTGPFGRPSTAEDCLYLNIYTPHRKPPRSGFPVMVWIPGGGFHSGAGSFYDPAALVADGVTVVTINYRVGALGFLAHPALADARGQSGDYGLMDQQAALRWVRGSISGFHGDAHNITIFGESAGGASALAQVVSPQAAGLFERAIAESGSYDTTQTTLAAAESAGTDFAAKAGCADQSAACLRALPVSTILADEATEYRPNLDTEVLPRPVGTALATGLFNHVPILNGTNHDEWRLMVAGSTLAGRPVTAADYQAMISAALGVSPARAAAVAARYPLTAYPSPALALGAVGTDAVFACPALTIDRSAARFVPTFAYEFNDENAPEDFLPPAGFPYGAPHASELQYLLGLPYAAYPKTLSAQQQQLATVMRTYWTNFAKTGSPTAAGTPRWPSFGDGSQRVQSLLPPAPGTETDFAATHDCAFWDRG